jgi:hypothetical protein
MSQELLEKAPSAKIIFVFFEPILAVESLNCQMLKVCDDEDIVNSILNESKHLIKSAFGKLPAGPSNPSSPIKPRKSPMKSPVKSPMKSETPKYRCSAIEFVESYDAYLSNE